MLKILIVEDDFNKCKQIKESLQKKWRDIYIDEKKSYQSGLKAIINGKYDLIILDMSMPTYDDGERFRAFAGRDILYEMQRRKKYTKTIIVTQFEAFGDDNKVSIEELKESVENNFKDIYMGIIYYNASLLNWKEEIIKIIENIIKL